MEEIYSIIFESFIILTFDLKSMLTTFEFSNSSSKKLAFSEEKSIDILISIIV